MSTELNSLLIVAALLLIPLVPAAVLYKVLTTAQKQPAAKRRIRAPAAAAAEGAAEAGKDAPPSGDDATGTIIMDMGPVGTVNLKFNVVGSTATYVVLLAVSVLIYMHLATLADREAQRRVEAMKNNVAWVVEMPVELQDVDGNVLPTDGSEMQQIRIDVAPALTMASAKTLTFRVLANEGKFPTARFNLPGIGLKPVVLDLNDSSKVRLDYEQRRINGIEPVWIVLGKPYGGANTQATTMEASQ